MNQHRFLPFAIFSGGFSSLFWGGEFGDTPVNIRRLPLEGCRGISISYIADKVTLYGGDDGGIAVKEYMNRDGKDYYARVTADGESITIEAGKTARDEFRVPFTHRHISSLFLPRNTQRENRQRRPDRTGTAGSRLFPGADLSGRLLCGGITADTADVISASGAVETGSLTGAVSIKTVSGSISTGTCTGPRFRADSGSGPFAAENINAGQAEIDSTSGSVTVKSMKADAELSTVSGTIRIDRYEGTGTIQSLSGSIRITGGPDMGDTRMKATSGSLTLTVPPNFPFRLSTKSTSGHISAPDTPDLGQTPRAECSLTTASGSIAVKR